VLRERTGARLAIHHLANACACSDRSLADGDEVRVGAVTLRVLETPGHTPESVSYLVDGRMVMTGDALLVGTCGRTDFQHGDPGALYDAIHARLFTLPDDVIVYPGHDYKGQTSSTIGRERAGNARLTGRTRDEFIALMSHLNLPPPRRIAEALPANERCGEGGIPHAS
jgi:glyoxylase-like metal-dependent hydrolase (beta-lactamase superfamily II)